MLRFLFSAGAVFILVLSMCLLPQTASARRCGMKMPETLLALYQNSDAIYIGTYDKTLDGEVVEDTADYSAVAIHKHFTITSTLKGVNRKFFVLDDRDYRYKNVAPEPEAAVSEDGAENSAVEEEVVYTGEEEEDFSTPLESGDNVLLFLRNGDEGTPVLTDYVDGIKKLPAESIAVYEARIKDLSSIFAAKKVSEARILDWLIRCAEDPATRWEGTYELLQGVRIQNAQEQAAERRKERQAKGLPPEEEAVEEEIGEPDEAESRPSKNVDVSKFVKMLDTNHKQTLANILLNPKYEKTQANGKSKEIAGDRELIELVSFWGDPRLLGFLLDKLRAGSDDPEYAAGTMATIAEILGDDEAESIASKYSSNAYEEGDAVVEEEDSDEEETGQIAAPVDVDESPVPEDSELPAEGIPAEAPDKKSPAGVPAVDDKILAKKQTYKELRTELMQKFLARCETVIAEQDAAKIAKAEH